MSELYLSGRARRLALAGVSALALAAGIGGAGFSLAGTDATAPTATVTASIPDIVAKAKPAVVTVTTELKVAEAAQGNAPGGQMGPDEFFRRFFGENGPGQGMPGMPGAPGGPDGGPDQPQRGGMALGSGFIVSADGYVVTNFHVVDKATSIKVTTDDGTEMDAKLIGHDAKNDIAVLKVDAKSPLPVLNWGDSDAMRLGDTVLAIGDPFGIGTTVTSGIISARGRDLHNGPYDDFLQIDAAINHGNSGGPLLGLDGKVIGINTAIYSPNGGNVGVGFAIPSVQAQAVVEKIVAGGGSIEHGYIGVMIQPVDKGVAEALGLAEPKGAIVASVGDGSPAAGAGVKAGDIIVAVNGVATETPKSVSRAIADLAPGDKATLTLWRDGKTEDLAFAVGSLNSDQVASADTGEAKPDPSSDVAVKDLGLTVQTVSGDQAQAEGLPEGTAGVMVTAVEGPAADKGIAMGDVILSVNRKPVTSAADLAKMIDQVKGERPSVLFLIERQGQQQFIAVPFKTA
ncbi:MAG: Do family serine endopeptidase [Paracoccaceae bacterium]